MTFMGRIMPMRGGGYEGTRLISLSSSGDIDEPPRSRCDNYYAKFPATAIADAVDPLYDGNRWIKQKGRFPEEAPFARPDSRRDDYTLFGQRVADNSGLAIRSTSV
jgi:hypothetical protein